MSIRRLLLANGHFPRVSCQSHLLDDKGHDEVGPPVAHRYPEIYLRTKGNPGKSQLEDPLKTEPVTTLSQMRLP